MRNVRCAREVRVLVCACLALLCLPPQSARAFCGFYVAGADAKLYANATMVVLLRDGTRTVLSMQNNYEGPAEAFALVIPVPSVLKKDQVKTLSKELFERVDMLSAPRLVEYWEHDPCEPDAAVYEGAPRARSGSGLGSLPTPRAASVTVLEQFSVDEYDIVILSAKDSNGLERWLREKHYNIPEGAADALAPYVAKGTKFFVAKVDPARVKMESGQAVLSPLRFHYDSPELILPVRLGLLNSHGSQDLIIHILAKSRYEVTNYPNVMLPTNLVVQDNVRDQFAAFFESVFTRTQEQTPGAVVTEYAWDSASCDPCPVPPLKGSEVAALGGELVGWKKTADAPQGALSQFMGPGSENLTLTRLHARYSRDSLGDDLLFKSVDNVTGGRGVPAPDGTLDPNPQLHAPMNNFQGRYVILHPWEKPVTCDKPQRGNWGGPERGTQPVYRAAKNAALTGGTPGKVDLSQVLAAPAVTLGVTDLKKAGSPTEPPTPAATTVAPPLTTATDTQSPQAPPAVKTGCACGVPGSRPDSRNRPAWLLLSIALLAWRRRLRGAG